MTVDRTMVLYHVTPAYNQKSISVFGLLRSACTSPTLLRRGGAIFLVTETSVAWAVKHTKRRYKCGGVVVYRVTVRRSWLDKNKRLGQDGCGFWRCWRDICPCKMSVERILE